MSFGLHLFLLGANFLHLDLLITGASHHPEISVSGPSGIGQQQIPIDRLIDVDESSSNPSGGTRLDERKDSLLATQCPSKTLVTDRTRLADCIAAIKKSSTVLISPIYGYTG